MIRRRRFIQVVAATALGAAVPAAAHVHRWTGRAMGADVSLDLYGATPGDLSAARHLITEMEARFSLYDPASELSRLNAGGSLTPSADMARVLALCGQVHKATDGLFDPTVQPVFRALALGQAAPWHLVGWDRVVRSDGHVRLGLGQALTLNGIAQGYATDRLRDLLAQRGLTRALVSVGEHAAIGGPFRLSLEDPVHGALGMRTLTDGALATSSPGAMRLGPQGHILHPFGHGPQWSTVSVEAGSAALADAASTALCLAPRGQVAEIADRLGLRVTLVDASGDLSRIGL